MLNLIRCVAICFVALFLSACTTIEAKRGFAVKTLGYEFTCAHEPSQTVIDGDVVKKLLEVATLLPSPANVYNTTPRNGQTFTATETSDFANCIERV